MRGLRVPAALLLWLFVIDALGANRRKQKERNFVTNICDIDDQQSNVHCYCKNSQEINKALATDCWIFNGGIDESDPIWASFISQSNIETLTVNVRADGALDFVPAEVFKYLKQLKVFVTKYGTITKVRTNTFENIKNIQEVTLTKNHIVVLQKYAFNNMPNLTILLLDENKIKELVTDTFYELPSLQKLYLTSNNITNIQDGAFRHLVNLLELELDKNNISELRKECFDGLANLKKLDLRNNKIAVLNSFTFIELWNLQILLLDNNEISNLGQRTFDGLSQLKKLSLSNNKLVTLDTKLFEGIRGLTALDLRFNKLRRLTFENIRPIYDNLKKQNSFIYLEGNDFPCDCHLAWMHRLRHEAKSVKVRSSLENFICKSNDLSIIPYSTNIEKTPIYSNNLYAIGDVNQISEANDNSEDLFYEEIDDSYVDEIKLVKSENERTLLQIPVESLPCPSEVKSVTVRTYTYPSQNEAKDYRNIISSSSIVLCMNVICLMFPFLILIS